jgi:preprotein translocase subunit Sec61beta
VAKNGAHRPDPAVAICFIFAGVLIMAIAAWWLLLGK